MGAILFQAVGLFMIILLGYFLKRKGLFKKEDGTILSRIIMTITLPSDYGWLTKRARDN